MKTIISRSLFAGAILGALLALPATSGWAETPQDKPVDSREKPVAKEENSASEADNADKLRKAAQNPIASLISVPIQENWNFGIGPADRIQNVLNVQPVIPVTVGKDWNLIVLSLIHI